MNGKHRVAGSRQNTVMTMMAKVAKINDLTAHAKTLTFLNAPVLTAPGSFNYEILTPDAARQIIRDFESENLEIRSAVGHEATADLMTRILEFPVKFNRIEFLQTVEDAALVFRLLKRAPEGKVFSCAELESIGYELGLLTRIK